MKQIEFEKLFADAAEKNGVASAARLHNFAPNLNGMMIELRNKLNSLPSEQPSGELEREIKLYQLRNPVINHSESSLNELIKRAAIYFANWQKEQLINKASQWLNKNVVEYHPRKGELRPIVNINAFREAMEKEDEQCSTE